MQVLDVAFDALEQPAGLADRTVIEQPIGGQ
jgi:hypothetical protein